MTQIEALTLALEALELINIEFVCGNGSHHKKEDRHEWDEDCPITNRWRKAIIAIKEALAQPEQEPVAIKRMKEWIEYLKYLKRTSDQHMKIPSEMSAGTCWELALELEQFINTAPPQTEQEPVANYCKECLTYNGHHEGCSHYTHPPQRKPLTNEQIWDAYMKAPVDIDCHVSDLHKFARAIEAAHGIKENT